MRTLSRVDRIRLYWQLLRVYKKALALAALTLASCLGPVLMIEGEAPIYRGVGVVLSLVLFGLLMRACIKGPPPEDEP